MGKEGISDQAPFAEDQDDLAKNPIPENLKIILNTGGKRVSDLVKQVPGRSPLTFEVKDALLEKTTLVPYYQIHRERYVVYWKMTGK